MAESLVDFNGMPKMSLAFGNWLTSITVIKVTQNNINGLVQDLETPMTFQGTVQPLKSTDIMLKPEGQRAWKWLQIHCFSTNLNLVTNDRIRYKGGLFKVMGVLDFSNSGFVEYHIVKDYE